MPDREIVAYLGRAWAKAFCTSTAAIWAATGSSTATRATTSPSAGCGSTTSWCCSRRPTPRPDRCGWPGTSSRSAAQTACRRGGALRPVCAYTATFCPCRALAATASMHRMFFSRILGGQQEASFAPDAPRHRVHFVHVHVRSAAWPHLGRTACASACTPPPCRRPCRRAGTWRDADRAAAADDLVGRPEVHRERAVNQRPCRRPSNSNSAVVVVSTPVCRVVHWTSPSRPAAPARMRAARCGRSSSRHPSSAPPPMPGSRR